MVQLLSPLDAVAVWILLAEKGVGLALQGARVLGVLHAVLLLLPLGLFPLPTHLKQLPQFVGPALQATGIQVVAVIQTEAEAEVSKALKEGGVTVEYQRKKAKEMVKFFKQQQYNQAVEDSQVFGMTPKNEINNGRWTMFGLLVGMMTEYATGVDFIDQIKLTISVMGIADVYD